MNISRASVTPFRALPVAFALIFNVVFGPLAPLVGPAVNSVAQAASAPVVTMEDDPTGCNGVRSTPGSENTNKRLISGSLEPGGTATFEITYPVDPSDVAGRTTFVITDCVFINGTAVAKYSVSFVPNTVNFVLVFTLHVPDNAPIGDEYCNYAKTTAAPSQSQASNRKAGPACFIIGGALRVSKVDGNGDPLAGAHFTVDCAYPTSDATLSHTVVSAPADGSVTDGTDANTTDDSNESYVSTSGGSLSAAVVTGSEGVIDVQAPVGTACSFIETAAPDGYLLPADTDVTLTVTLGQQQTHTFVNVLEHPLLEVSKTADHATVNAGGQIGFTIDTSSTGTSAVKAATLSDQLPGGSGVNWSISPSYADQGSCAITGTAPTQTLNCSFGDLAVGASTSVHVVSDTTAASCKAYSNTATADADNFDAVTSTASTTVQCPSLVLVKTPDGGTVRAGHNIRFTLTLTNNGAGSATNVDIDDVLPAGFTWAENPNKTECSIASGALHCDIPSLASGASFAVTVSAPTDTSDCSANAYTNHATADADNFAQVSDDGDVKVLCADVSVQKSGNGPITAGDSATFSMLVSASGNSVSPHVTLNDNLPAGINWSLGGADAASCSINTAATPDALSCAFGSMAAGTSKTITVSGTADNGTCPSISNTATVASDFDTDATNNSSSADITVNCPNLKITKSADNGTISAGDLAAYTIVVTNEGPGTASNVHVDEGVPAGVSWAVSVADPQPAGTTCASSVATDQSQSVSCDFASLAAGASVTIHLSGRTDTADCGTLHNVATVSGDNEDPSLLDDNSAAADIVAECPGLNIAKSNDQTQSALPGTNVSYTLLVTLTDGTARNVTVVDTLPNGLDAPTNISDAGTWDSAGRTITWHLGDVSAEASPVTVTYQARVSADVANGTTLRNVAIVFSPNSQCPDAETIGPECTDSSTVTTRVPTLVIAKAADHTTVDVTAGKDTTVTWTLTYTLANGPVTNAVISDPLPTGLNYVAGSASNGGTYDAASRALTWTFASLGTSGSVTFKTTVDASVGGGVTLVNVATIDSNETAPDTGTASVGTAEQEQHGSTGTPVPSVPSVPNTALGSMSSGQPLNVPIWLMLLVCLGSLGGLTLANVKAVQRRR